MEAMRPRIRGWGLAAGIVLWFTAALALYWAITMWPNDPAGELPLLLIGIGAATVGIAFGFWRGNRVARWLAILPAIALFLVALVFFGLGSMCAADTPRSERPGQIAWSCAEPRPEPTLGDLLLRYGLPLGLAASGVVVLVGVWRPGVRESTPDGPPPAGHDQ